MQDESHQNPQLLAASVTVTRADLVNRQISESSFSLGFDSFGCLNPEALYFSFTAFLLALTLGESRLILGFLIFGGNHQGPFEKDLEMLAILSI